MFSFYDMCYGFMFFFIMSVLGYFAECTFVSLENKKFVYNRGFLMGPYIPIYGAGACSVIILLKRYMNDPIVFFLLTSFTCSFIEYITSYVMEKVFKVRWWDYSGDKFNINGRICLKNSFLFGLAGLAILYTIYPLICSFLSFLPKIVLEVIAVICFIAFVSDFIFTVKALINVKTSLKNIKGDATQEAHEEVMKALEKHRFQFNRLINSHPNIEKFNSENVIKFKERMIELRKMRLEKRK